MVISLLKYLHVKREKMLLFNKNKKTDSVLSFIFSQKNNLNSYIVRNN